MAKTETISFTSEFLMPTRDNNNLSQLRLNTIISKKMARLKGVTSMVSISNTSTCGYLNHLGRRLKH